ncbi:hypothetical protein DFJ77DRAFT_447623 [Powellomyces hirtus]|nr:hypothetical protein DFJ77DRAFT_447623 [Powellomyces hirtus]
MASTAPRPPTISVLPTELIKEILSQIQCQSTLSRASQTCKVWHALATPLVFHAPDFHNKSSFERFLVAVESGSQVGRLVRELNLLSTPQHWEFVTDTALERVCKSCPELVHLDLEGCLSVRDKGLKAISENAPQLLSLSLSFCDRITDVGVKYIAEGCPSLILLELKCLPFVSDDSVREIANSCSHLESVNLGGTRITENSVVDLFAKCKKLTFLDLSSCYNIAYPENFDVNKPEGLEIVFDSLMEGDAPWESDGSDGEWEEDEGDNGQFPAHTHFFHHPLEDYEEYPDGFSFEIGFDI